MKTVNLDTNQWQLTGWFPDLWRLGYTMEMGTVAKPVVTALAKVLK